MRQITTGTVIILDEVMNASLVNNINRIIVKKQNGTLGIIARFGSNLRVLWSTGEEEVPYSSLRSLIVAGINSYNYIFAILD